jgi:hypothetical protein
VLLRSGTDGRGKRVARAASTTRRFLLAADVVNPPRNGETMLSRVGDHRDTEVGDNLVSRLERAAVVGVPVEELVFAEGGGEAACRLSIGAVAADVCQVRSAQLLGRNESRQFVRDAFVESGLMSGALRCCVPSRSFESYELTDCSSLKHLSSRSVRYPVFGLLAGRHPDAQAGWYPARCPAWSRAAFGGAAQGQVRAGRMMAPMIHRIGRKIPKMNNQPCRFLRVITPSVTSRATYKSPSPQYMCSSYVSVEVT